MIETSFCRGQQRNIIKLNWFLTVHSDEEKPSENTSNWAVENNNNAA